jgi:hypothetical protein
LAGAKGNEFLPLAVAYDLELETAATTTICSSILFFLSQELKPEPSFAQPASPTPSMNGGVVPEFIVAENPSIVLLCKPQEEDIVPGLDAAAVARRFSFSPHGLAVMSTRRRRRRIRALKLVSETRLCTFSSSRSSTATATATATAVVVDSALNALSNAAVLDANESVRSKEEFLIKRALVPVPVEVTLAGRRQKHDRLHPEVVPKPIGQRNS